MMTGAMNDLQFRLGDMRSFDAIRIQCVACQKIAMFPEGFFQRKHRFRSDFLVFDLQYRLKCSKCKSQGPFKISIIDRGGTGSPERHIVRVGEVVRLVRNE